MQCVVCDSLIATSLWRSESKYPTNPCTSPSCVTVISTTLEVQQPVVERGEVQTGVSKLQG